ncbi:hypothetical protein PF0225 [Pyrococcus furiosus DSM 3638]|uniref:N-acetyltransferase domain-containing protein n=1 Tax=Pyrococcus furiosus (strain ATCC 43587 / DSM 3638 / JCM 8422 / Vc1) TaxID=186497 RepID=Q8U467_PYRFU|nr:hypothetical protein PF0225 [Pyrococcus furiosus DSM 3638]
MIKGTSAKYLLNTSSHLLFTLIPSDIILNMSQEISLMVEVKIEKLKNLDEKTLRELIDVYMSGYKGLEEYGGEGEDYAREYIQWCWRRAQDGFFVAKVGDKIVGFIVCVTVIGIADLRVRLWGQSMSL